MEELYLQIARLLSERPDDLEEQLQEFHPFDVSQVLLGAEEEALTNFFGLNNDFIAEVLGMLEEEEEFLDLTDNLSPRKLSNIIAEMDVDDAVDVLKAMDEEDVLILLRMMDKDIRNEIKQIMNYPESSAGAIMSTDYISVPVSFTIKQAMKQMIAMAEDTYEINVIYIVDEKEKLIGLLSLRELIVARASESLEELMTTNIISVKPLTDQSIVAETMSDYDFTIIPVVNRLGRMLGIVTIDDIVDVLVEEHTEDMSQIAGVSDIDLDAERTNVWQSVKNRFPWLVILLFVGFLTSMIIASFEDTLNQVPILAMFLPLILNMSGNTGVQSLAVTVRGITTNQFETRADVITHLWREFQTAVVNALLLSLLVFILSLIMGRFIGQTAISFSLVISVSVFLALVLATLAGAFIPIVINSLKIDPAVASGPFITTINDIISLTVYLTLATIFIVGLS